MVKHSNFNSVTLLELLLAYLLGTAACVLEPYQAAVGGSSRTPRFVALRLKETQ